MEPDTLRTVENYLKFSKNPHKRTFLLKDSDIIPFLVYVLDDKNDAVVLKAMETLSYLTDRPEDRKAVENTCGIDQALKIIVEKGRTEQTREGARRLMERLRGECEGVRDKERPANPLQELQTSYEGPADKSGGMKQAGLSTGLVAGGGKRRGVKFMAGPSRTRSLTFQLPRLLNSEEKKYVEEILLAMKGIVSIYFDSFKGRYVLRVKQEVNAEMIAKAVLHSGLVAEVDQIVKDETGQETLIKFEDGLTDDEKENLDPSASASYLSESFGDSPKASKEEGVIVPHGHHDRRREKEGGNCGAAGSEGEGCLIPRISFLIGCFLAVDLVILLPTVPDALWRPFFSFQMPSFAVTAIHKESYLCSKHFPHCLLASKSATARSSSTKID